jgi:hypothetical protein
MKITDLPLGEVPFLTIDRLVEKKKFDPDFVPGNWKEDLKTGRPTPLVYWYPQYIDFLYEIAMNGESHQQFLWDFNPYNWYWFPMLFKEVDGKLVKLANNSIRLNHLDETLITNGKVKL